MKKIIIACVVALPVCIFIAFVVMPRSSPAPHVRAPLDSELLLTAAEDPAQDLNFSVAEVPSWTSETVNQYYSLSEYRFVTLIDDQLVNGAWSRNQHVSTTSFDTTAITSRGKDELFLAGLSDGGECVIEKWRFKKLAFPNGTTTKVPARTELYRGLELCPIRQLGVDPEQRFLLVLSGAGAQGKLHVMPISTNATPTLLYSHSSSFPLGGMEYMERYQHTSLGRVWILTKEPELSNGVLLDDTAIILVDSQNDGSFENTIVGDAHDLYLSGVLGASTILTSYDND
jgi:hypothetical protein